MASQSERECKPREKSRLLRLGKWTAIASSAVTSILTLGEAFGYMSTDWTCIVLLIVMGGIGVTTYYLRLKTEHPIE